MPFVLGLHHAREIGLQRGLQTVFQILDGLTFSIDAPFSEVFMEMQVLQKDDDLTVIALDGRLDLAGVQEIQNQFYGHTAEGKKSTILDMSKVSFLASLGIRMLVETAKGLRTTNAKLVLLKPQDLVERSLRSSGLDVILSITQDEDEARKLASVSP